MTRVYGNKVTNTSSGSTRTWRLYADYSVSSTETAYTIKGTSLGVQNTTSPSAATMGFNANSLTVSYSGVLTASYKRTKKTGEIKGGATFEVYGTDKSAVIERTRVAQTKSLTFKGVANSNTAWDGTSTKTVSFTIPARSSHIVSYDANGGSGSIEPFTKFYSATGETAYYETLSDGSGFSKANYRITGWNTMADGSGTSYPLSGDYTANGTTAVTLYAQWETTYVKPEIQNLLAFRTADASGGVSPTVTSTGTTGFCKFQLVGGANYTFTSATVQFGTATANSMTQSGTTVYGYSDVGVVAEDSAYTVNVTVVVTGTDGISRTYTDSTYISKSVPVFDATPNSFALGGVARDVTGDKKPFDCYMDASFHGKVNAKDADFNGTININGIPIKGCHKIRTLRNGSDSSYNYNSIDWYMDGDKTVLLEETVSSQQNGLILVWSFYNGGAKNWGWNFTVIPKIFVTDNTDVGGLSTFMSENGTLGNVGVKYIYVRDDRIIGNDNNSKSGTGKSGIKYNNKFVLRWVYGF